MAWALHRKLRAWLASWRVQVTLLMSTPILLGVFLVLLDFALGVEMALSITALVFAGTAGTAVIVSGALAWASVHAWSLARWNFSQEDSRRLIATLNAVVNLSLFACHAMFLVAGLAAVFLDAQSLFRISLTRLGVVDAQWILLMAGISSFLIHKRIRQLIADQMSVVERIDYEVALTREDATEAVRSRGQINDAVDDAARSAEMAQEEAGVAADAIHKKLGADAEEVHGRLDVAAVKIHERLDAAAKERKEIIERLDGILEKLEDDEEVGKSIS